MAEYTEILVFLSLSIVLVWIFYRAYHRSVKKANAEVPLIQPDPPPSGKTIVSGTPPHQMTGEITEALRKLGKLPDTGWTPCDALREDLQQAINAAKATRAFSALDVLRSEESAHPNMNDGIGASFRADCVRPANMHVSQSLWDEERELYVLDEWINLGTTTYVNAGLWFETQDQDQKSRLTNLNENLFPEFLLTEILDQGIARSGAFTIGEAQYLFVETDIITASEHGEATAKMQTWINRDSHLIAKSRLLMYEDGVMQIEKTTTIAAYGAEFSVCAPDWINCDSSNVIVDNRICVVEHW